MGIMGKRRGLKLRIVIGSDRLHRHRQRQRHPRRLDCERRRPRFSLPGKRVRQREPRLHATAAVVVVALTRGAATRYSLFTPRRSMRNCTLPCIFPRGKPPASRAAAAGHIYGAGVNRTGLSSVLAERAGALPALPGHTRRLNASIGFSLSRSSSSSPSFARFLCP